MNSQEVTYFGAFIAGLLSFLSPCVLPLVPPYLTMPLMDEVLIPFQNGQHIGERGNGLAVPEPYPRDFVRSGALNIDVHIGGPPRFAVVHDEELAITALADVDLDHVHGQGHGPMNGFKGILKRVGRISAVGEHEGNRHEGIIANNR